MALKIAINGTGRIGMIAARIIGQRDDIELVALNTTATPETLAHLLKYDSVHGKNDVELLDNNTIRVGKDTAKVFSDRNPANVDFSSAGAELVLECTGVLMTKDAVSPHIKGSVKRVILSGPSKDDTKMFVFGTNHKEYNGESIISNASCTTNCLAPLVSVLDNNFGLENGLMTTIHSYTNDQNILDVKHKDIRRARAAAVNMIPTTTGAAKAISKVIPSMTGKLNGYAMRVPTPDVSIVDLTANLSKSITKEKVNEAFQKASQGEFKDLLIIDNEKRVSSDFIGCTASSIFVPDMTSVIGEKTVKVLAWYDNEWGYTSRLIDMAVYVGQN